MLLVPDHQFISELFVYLDKDKDELLSREELVAFEMTLAKGHHEAALQGRRDDSTEAGAQLLEEKDADGDGSISRAEFVQEESRPTFEVRVQLAIFLANSLLSHL